jgi:hypothetical protein
VSRLRRGEVFDSLTSTPARQNHRTESSTIRTTADLQQQLPKIVSFTRFFPGRVEGLINQGDGWGCMASVSSKLLRPECHSAWRIPEFIWDARRNDRFWRNSLRRIAGCLRVACYHVHEFSFRLFVWVSDVHDVLTVLEEDRLDGQ